MSINQKEKGKYFPFSFHGKTREYFSIWIVNVFLCIITLGVYTAWAIIKEWRYFYENTELAGSRFELSAMPTQILKFILLIYGFLAVMLVPFINIFILLAVMLSMPLIIIILIRFCLASTRFRGHSFDYVCKGVEAYMACLVWPIVSLLVIMIPAGLTLSSTRVSGDIFDLNSCFLAIIIMPFIIMRWAIQNYLYMKMLVNNVVIGNARFFGSFRKSAFIKFHFYACIITIPFLIIGLKVFGPQIDALTTLKQTTTPGEALLQAGIILKMYAGILFLFIGNYLASLFLHVWLTNYVCQTIVLDNDIRITSTMGHRSYLKLALLNMVMVICSFGLCIPHARIRTAKYMAGCIAIEGDIDRILPHPEKATEETPAENPDSLLF
ncbi:YjgN family protein [Rahnella ecdela]|uniref:DUF898 family protein n=1 Tax=Rahnella ecdela TaxID=2816250 RepID=A0ABS6LCL2_9GAMM|nr:DUF898 family protein [Rahnella ecdela]MBU9844672.1 DUF898 family protein [Rahnella ecdela]